LAPIPPLLPTKQIKAGGDTSYAVGLIVAASLFSVAWIPLAVRILQGVFHMPLEASSEQLASIVFLNILTPLACGALIRRFAPAFAQRIKPTLVRAGNLLLLAVVVAILYRMWRPMFSEIGGGTLAALLVFIIVGLVSGHVLGGPDPDHRTVLALASASRHPGISMALAHLNFPNEKSVVAVVALYLVVSTLVALPYVAWRRRIRATSTFSSGEHS
jgi:BASS family bile acid:Na+ symporter